MSEHRMDEITTMLNAAQKIGDLTAERDMLRSIVERLAEIHESHIISHSPAGEFIGNRLIWSESDSQKLDALIQEARELESEG